MARQVGGQVSSVFNDAGGTNPHGLEVVSILLATEAGGSNISTTNSIASFNGYQVAGLDATDGGQNLRDGFAYFRGVPITSWPVSDRRRAIVINGTANSSSHSQWEIVYNELAPNSADMLAAINGIQAGPMGLDYATWQADFTFPDGLAGANSDPDGDGATNLFEFFSGTDPLNRASSALGKVQREDGTLTFQYQVAKDRIGLSHKLQTGPLDSFQDFTPESEVITPIDDNIDLITVTLPPGQKSFIRQIITIIP